MRVKLVQTVSHPQLKEPISTDTVAEGRSKADIVKNLMISGKQACELKNHGITKWKDSKGSEISLQLIEVYNP